jgi:hypothetical protein
VLLDICYHYKYKIDYVESLDTYEFNLLARGIHRMKSQNMLESFTVADYPNMESKTRKKIHKEVFKVAYPEQMKKRIVTADDLLKHGFEGLK